MEAIMVDRTAAAAAEIAALRQKLAAAEARIQEMGRHNATEGGQGILVPASMFRLGIGILKTPCVAHRKDGRLYCSAYR